MSSYPLIRRYLIPTLCHRVLGQDADFRIGSRDPVSALCGSGATMNGTCDCKAPWTLMKSEKQYICIYYNIAGWKFFVLLNHINYEKLIDLIINLNQE